MKRYIILICVILLQALQAFSQQTDSSRLAHNKASRVSWALSKLQVSQVDSLSKNLKQSLTLIPQQASPENRKLLIDEEVNKYEQKLRSILTSQQFNLYLQGKKARAVEGARRIQDQVLQRSKKP